MLSRYEILAKLGQGGAGAVYRARDVELKRDVALKFLLRDGPEGSIDRARFLREARTAASLNHPAICTIHEVGQVEPGEETVLPDGRHVSAGAPFIAMELIGGRTLLTLIETSEAGTLDRLLDFAIQIADGLATAHAQGIVHRDLKPGNVMITTDGSVKIVDFGLAKAIPAPAPSPDACTTIPTSELTGEGMIAGTVAYMPPEQIRGGPVDARSDVFSFGTMLFEMVTGQRPFGGECPASTLAKILEVEPQSILALKPDLPAELARITDRCLRKEPEDRYANGHDLAVALRRLQEAQEAAPSSDSRTALRPLRWSLGLSLGAVALLALLFGLDAGGLRHRLTGGPSAPRIRSLAVLPLENLSGDPDQDYFADGMTEALIVNLAQIEALRVISRTSAMQYKGSRKSMPQIARELNVDAVIEGSVLREKDRVRITAQLIDGPKDRHLWSESYERDVHDLLGLQAEVALSIANHIRAELAPRDLSRLGRTRRVQPEVYEAYLRGRYFNGKFENSKAVEYYQLAIRLDPGYAPAYAGLAESYVNLQFFGRVPLEQTYPKARAAAMRALELDDTLAEAHRTLGAVLLMDWEWSEAERELRRACDLNPGDPESRELYGHYLAIRGRFDESLAEMKQARDLDPLSNYRSAQLGGAYFRARRYDLAIEHLRETIDLYPQSLLGHLYLGESYLQEGLYENGVSEIRESIALQGIDPDRSAPLARAFALWGRKDEAKRILENVERDPERSADRIDVAAVYAALGEEDQALAYLEAAYRAHDGELILLKADPRFDGLAARPEFARLLQNIGL